ncbi:MAG: DNA recombination protein RmuC, partial [Pseudomonadota bacterium]
MCPEGCTNAERLDAWFAREAGLLADSWQTLDAQALVLLLIGAAVGACACWALIAAPAGRRAALAEARAADRAARLAPLEAEAAELRRTLIAVERDAARLDGALETERAAHAARLEELRAAETRLSRHFQGLAGEVLGENSRRFLALVSERFAAENEGAQAALTARETAIDAMLKPLSDALTRFEGRVGALETAREGAYRAVEEQVKAVQAQNVALTAETRRLVQALRAPKTRGRWGEMQARRVFEMAGMLEAVDFHEETGVVTDEGDRLRPDFTVHLPGGRSLVIDAKTPLDAYLDLVDAPDPA